MSSPPLRIAMWSGPRNISTALMRAWGNRPDTAVIDEPFYAYYLAATRIDHPGAEEIMAHYPTDWRTVAAQLAGPVPDGKPIWYQKHMTHHILPEVDLGWIEGFANCFLIREPVEVIGSYIQVRPDPTLDDIGLPQQRRIFDHVRRMSGHVPPVIEARDVLDDPKRSLARLCEAIGVPFSEAMLTWPAGRSASDGIWAKHWYAAVERSTGFEPYRPLREQLPSRLHGLLEEAQALYAEISAYRLACEKSSP